MPASKEQDLWKERLYRRIVANYGDMGEEASNRRAVGELLRHIFNFLSVFHGDDIASSVCKFEGHGRLIKVQ